ncbi:ABC transporter permease [Aquisalibacillus elongatus]|uniref:ABC-2 type transport system permease protein n=1 Tax=Aquisalibacillus elongatus TaxID=485577 RepID=A0A3N5C1N0_9BACI|nr:ABC transporter permease [Aquisalibacillus elongatus]RPF53292.1 ABC-2 type transport system permease protein [Aquisalibacillus elongatus]
MWNFLKKDLLVLLRDKTELAVLITMPLILTAILGFALGGLMSGETDAMESKLAIVNDDNAEEGFEHFVSELDEQPIPEDAKQRIIEGAEAYQPSTIIQETFKSDELSSIFELTYLEETQAQEALMNEEVSAILVLPEDFTFKALRKMLLNEGNGSELTVITADHSSVSASTIESVVDMVIGQMNVMTAISMESQGAITFSEYEMSPGEIKSVTDRDPMSAMQYYAFAMAAMFGLYIASTIARKSYVETFQNVYSRIVLAGKHPMFYLSGKGISTVMLVTIQVALLLVISIFILRAFMFETLTDWLGIGLITFVYALCVGAIGVLLTSITLLFESASIPELFTGAVVSILAFLGGSFVPQTQLPEIINTIGNFTPNGLALTAYLQWSQGLGFEYITPSLIKLLVMAVIILVIGLVLFPRKRVV